MNQNQDVILSIKDPALPDFATKSAEYGFSVSADHLGVPFGRSSSPLASFFEANRYAEKVCRDRGVRTRVILVRLLNGTQTRKMELSRWASVLGVATSVEVPQSPPFL